jgi:predicted amidohydrolase
MKIALVQFETKIGQDFSGVSKRVISFIERAKKKNCDLICFPEEFWFGPLDYYPKIKREEIVNRITPQIIKFFQEQAKNYSINIIPGSFIVKENNFYFNKTLIINKKGKIILTHKKQKLVPFGFEGENVTPGNDDLNVVKIDGIKIGVLICRELFYPHLFKELREKGAEIIFIPSFWSKRSSDYLRHNLKNKIKVWSEMKVIDALCQARAFENELAICFCNASGRLKYKNKFSILAGRTQVCLPFYGCIKNLKQNKEGMIVFNFDKSIIEDARKAYRLLE